MHEDTQRHKDEAEKIDPPEQGKEEEGNHPQPKHTEATPLKPMGT